MGNVVCDGSSFSCPFCSSPLKIKVTSSAAFGSGKLLANTSNCFFPPPGGMCSVTQSPCVPNTSVTAPGQHPIYIEGSPALGSANTFMCSQGGTIKYSESAQTAAQHTKTSPASPEEEDIAIVVFPLRF
ncbi:MAG: PAAR-like protein [Rhabdochlamydiaceae bacterium]